MRTTKVALAGLLAFMAFSGCFGEDAGETASTGSTGTTTTAAGANATSGGVAQNTPPTASFVIAANGTELVPENGSIAATAGTNLTFDATSSSDAEDADLTFAWDFGDNGTASNATVVHAFAEAGNYTVRLTVTDPGGATGEANASLAVAAVEAAAPAYYFFDDADTPQAWTFTRQIISPNAGVTVQQNHPTSQGWHATTKQKFSGAKSWTFQDDDINGYHDAELSVMVSPKIDLTAATSANFSFLYKGDSEAGSGEDFTWSISVAGGAYTKLGGTDAIVADWTLVSVDLAKYVGKSIQIRFYWQSDESCSKDARPSGSPVCGDGSHMGYFVDDIMIKPM